MRAQNRNAGVRLAAGLLALVACMAAADGSWLKHVPAKDRARVNPYAGQADAIAAGAKLFEDHCSPCHGADALGRGKRPSLRSERVQQATDGEIAWLLKNGNLAKGMPSWSAIPEPSRWQVIAYLKSLGENEAAPLASAHSTSSQPSTPDRPDNDKSK
ncbi:MAG TPA: c-type cytochrome [Candidatus Aquilonibacter sp.]|nr:c-type cytochrome [Candidatus Aquilonibacter sp.]